VWCLDVVIAVLNVFFPLGGAVNIILMTSLVTCHGTLPVIVIRWLQAINTNGTVEGCSVIQLRAIACWATLRTQPWSSYFGINPILQLPVNICCLSQPISIHLTDSYFSRLETENYYHVSFSSVISYKVILRCWG